MIGIIGAMEEEVAALLDYMNVKEQKMILDSKFYEGTICGKDVVLLQGGIGKINAAICTSNLLSNYAIDYVINIGTAGGLHSDQKQGDVVISTKVAHHDVDVCGFGYPYGQVPGMPIYFEADKDLIDKATRKLEELDVKAHTGLIVSGDAFIHTGDQVNFILSNFPDALCSEMEAASIAQTCYKYKTPFIITRSLSDVYGNGASTMQFDDFIHQASKASAKMCIALIGD